MVLGTFALLLPAALSWDLVLANETTVTNIVEIRNLSREAIMAGHSVRVRGIVTLRDEENASFNMQDSDAGIWVSLHEARRRKIWTGDEISWDQAVEGQEVEVEGLVGPGGYSPMLLPRSIRVLGTQPLPAVRPMDPSRFFNGADDCLRVEVRGIVQGYRQWGGRWDFLLDANPGRFNVEIPTNRMIDPERLVDAMVLVRGVAFTRFNTRGEIMWPRIFLGHLGECIVEQPSVSANEVPLVPLEELRAFRSDPLGPHRVRIQGVVTLAAEHFFYLQQGARAVRVETRVPCQLKPGNAVEAIGFISDDYPFASLREAVVRVTGSSRLPEVLAADPEDIIEATESGARTGVPHPFSDLDGRIVRFRARLLAVQGPLITTETWRRIVLQRGDMVMGATMHGDDARQLDRLEPGSDVEVSGLVQLDFTRDVRTADYTSTLRLNFLLRDASDVMVIKTPSWWTQERLFLVVSAFASLLVAVMLWAILLKRQVSRQMDLISNKLQAEAVSEERNRMARDLHDTLEQQLAGIALQIDGARSDIREHPGAASEAMDLAGRMLRHTRAEARRSVWELRSQVLEKHGLEMALRTMVESSNRPGGPEIIFEAHGEDQPLGNGVDYQLLRIAQEALTNAIKHAGADRIVMVYDRNAKGVNLMVRDDGKGFHAAETAHDGLTHFGLMGMRERAAKIGAELNVVGHSGKGCEISVFIPHKQAISNGGNAP